MSYQERKSLTPTAGLFWGEKLPVTENRKSVDLDSFIYNKPVSRSRPQTPLDLFKQRMASPTESQCTVYSTISEVEDPSKRDSFFYVASMDASDTTKAINHPDKVPVGIDLFEKPPVMNNKWVTPLAVRGFVTPEIFQKCLDIYDNNQACLLESYNTDSCEEDQVIVAALLLEEWFYLIIEPFSNDKEWQEREILFKLNNNHSEYCIKQIRELIGGVRPEIREFLVNFYRQHNLLI